MNWKKLTLKLILFTSVFGGALADEAPVEEMPPMYIDLIDFLNSSYDYS